MPVLRWLLPLVFAVALVGQAWAGWAAVGTFGESTCCCPTPEQCRCHDHDEPHPDAQMKRCGGSAQLVAPAAMVAVSPAAPAIFVEARVAIAPAPAPAELKDGLPIDPEIPPF